MTNIATAVIVLDDYLCPVSLCWSKLFLCASGIYILKTKCLTMVTLFKISAFMWFNSYVL